MEINKEQQIQEKSLQGMRQDQVSSEKKAQLTPLAEIAEPQKLVEKKQLAVGETGKLIFTNIEEQFRFATMLSKSKLLPQCWDTPDKILVGLQFCYELDLPPLVSLGSIAPINGRCVPYGDLPLAMVQRKGLLTELRQYFITEDGKETYNDDYFAAVVEGKKKGMDNQCKVVFTIKDAKTAGLWQKSQVWQKFPKRMLNRRALAQFLKDTCPEALYGISILEYDFHVLDPKDIEEVKETKADMLNKLAGIGTLPTTPNPDPAGG